MSEYQVFEFAAIDEPLNERQMRELRAISTRAEITPTSFWNEYHWGNFKGDPRKMVAGYFDAFMHYANFGTLWCMFRLPKEAVDVKALKQLVLRGAIGVSLKGEYVIVDLCVEDEPGDYETPHEQSLGELLPARAALLEGDLGPLYVTWLAAVQRRLVDDDSREPCDVSQIPALAAGTRALAEFFGVSPALLKAAYEPAQKSKGTGNADKLVKWVQSLSPQEKDKTLARFLTEPANVVRSKLQKQFRDSRAQDDVRASEFEPRMVTRLLSAADMEEGPEVDCGEDEAEAKVLILGGRQGPADERGAKLTKLAGDQFSAKTRSQEIAVKAVKASLARRKRHEKVAKFSAKA
jgi:hypothetical protein